MARELEIRRAAERLDVLEDELPRENCEVAGCNRSSAQPLAGTWRTLYFCSRHRPLYRTHNRILQRIRAL